MPEPKTSPGTEEVHHRTPPDSHDAESRSRFVVQTVNEGIFETLAIGVEKPWRQDPQHDAVYMSGAPVHHVRFPDGALRASASLANQAICRASSASAARPDLVIR